jgi:hypothetical protein
MVLAMHQRNLHGQPRFGFFFEPEHWSGEPVNREPGKHSELIWADPAHLPPDTVDYTATAISAIEEGKHFLVTDGSRHLPRSSPPDRHARPSQETIEELGRRWGRGRHHGPHHASAEGRTFDDLARAAGVLNFRTACVSRYRLTGRCLEILSVVDFVNGTRLISVREVE